MNTLKLMALAGACLGIFTQFAFAQLADTKAVSAPNGKVSLTGGWDAANGNSGSLDYGAAAAFAMPLGDSFGFQGDLATGQMAGTMSYSAAGHFFTRDPNAYLLGVVGGGVFTSTSSNLVIGPEAELYTGPLTLGGSGGFVANSLNGIGSNSYFAQADAKFYPISNLKLELGVGTFSNAKTAHAGLEWQVSDSQPITISTIGTIGDNNFVSANVGLTFYFGGTSNTLINRHRHEDPVNFSQMLVYYNGAYRTLYVVTPTTYTAPSTGGTCAAGYALTPAGGCVKVL